MQLKTLFESVKATVLGCYLYSEKVDLNAHKLAQQGAVSDSCPDNFILETRFDGERWHIPTEFSRTEAFTRQDLPEGRCLFIILESPHVSEFEGEKPMPATGTTGDNVLLAFTTLLNNHFPAPDKEVTYSVVLVNAIQHQTSLGAKPTFFRDSVFREMWDAGANEVFTTRIRELVRSGDAVINACTCGKTKVSQFKLRESVQLAVDEALSPIKSEVTFLRTEHPSVWGRIFNTANKNKTFADFGWRALSPKWKKTTGEA